MLFVLPSVANFWFCVIEDGHALDYIVEHGSEMKPQGQWQVMTFKCQSL